MVAALTARWDESRDALAEAEPGWLALALLLAALGMVAIALPWRRAASLLGVRLTWCETVAWYFMGEIGKYIPGAVWPVVGRAQLARRVGAGRAAAFGSVVYSLAALYLAAAFAAAVSGVVWSLALLPVALVLLHHRPLEWMLRRVERLAGRDISVPVPRWRDSITLVACYLPAWLLIGTATWSVARALNTDLDWLDVVFATALSWLSGFLVVPAPGGVGVREATFVAVVSLPVGVGAAVAVVARLTFVVVDAVGAVVASVLSRRLRSTATP